MREIFLYGAGGYGKTALDCFLNHNSLEMIVGIIDNNPGLQNMTIFNKPIYSYGDAKNRINSNSLVLITVELEIALEIAKELRNDGIICYLFWACEQY